MRRHNVMCLDMKQQQDSVRMPRHAMRMQQMTDAKPTENVLKQNKKISNFNLFLIETLQKNCTNDLHFLFGI